MNKIKKFLKNELFPIQIESIKSDYFNEHLMLKVGKMRIKSFAYSSDEEKSLPVLKASLQKIGYQIQKDLFGKKFKYKHEMFFVFLKIKIKKLFRC